MMDPLRDPTDACWLAMTAMPAPERTYPTSQRLSLPRVRDVPPRPQPKMLEMPQMEEARETGDRTVLSVTCRKVPIMPKISFPTRGSTFAFSEVRSARNAVVNPAHLFEQALPADQPAGHRNPIAKIAQLSELHRSVNRAHLFEQASPAVLAAKGVAVVIVLRSAPSTLARYEVIGMALPGGKAGLPRLVAESTFGNCGKSETSMKSASSALCLPFAKLRKTAENASAAGNAGTCRRDIEMRGRKQRTCPNSLSYEA